MSPLSSTETLPSSTCHASLSPLLSARHNAAMHRMTHGMCRFLDVNLNRIYDEDNLCISVSPTCKSYEHTLIGRLMLAVQECTEYLDIHSTSAATPPFAFHMGQPEAASYAASFPVAYTLDDRSKGSRGTAIAYAAEVWYSALSVSSLGWNPKGFVNVSSIPCPCSCAQCTGPRFLFQ